MAGAIVSQTWILTKKTLLVVFVRHWFFTSVRAFWAPIIFVCRRLVAPRTTMANQGSAADVLHILCEKLLCPAVRVRHR